MNALEVAAVIAPMVNAAALAVVFVDIAMAKLGLISVETPRRLMDAVELPVGANCLILATYDAWTRDWLRFVINSATGALFLRSWWNGRGRRRAAKLASQVKDLGHRLAVVPASEVPS